MTYPAPQNALAQGTSSTIPNSLRRPGTTTSENNQTNGKGNYTDRSYVYTLVGAVVPGAITLQTIQSGATIDGYGLAVTSTFANSSVTVVNEGTVTLTSGIPSAGGISALNINANGGNI